MPRRPIHSTLPLALASLLACSACSTPMPVPAGRSGVMATFERPNLSAVLPVEARVPAVLAAAESTVRARGYSVLTQSVAEELGHVVAQPPQSADAQRVRIEAYKVFQGTKVVITFQPWGDNASSRSILDGMLQRLGL